MEPRFDSILQSVTRPLGVHAQAIDGLWHVMLIVCAVMYVLVLTFLVLALFRRRSRPGSSEPALSRSLVGWGGLITVGLFSLTLASFFTDRALVRAAAEPHVSLRVTAHQWWWDVQYEDPVPSRRVRTSNEIHLPVNAQVHIQLAASDVIHSFWVPNLHGKRDLIPGRVNEIRLQPRSVGTFRGQCAEFCGVQHAHMALQVTVEPEESYRAWLDQQRTSARSPATPEERQGQRVFMTSACNLCHAISGTDASATVGPDLSHVASRATLGAGRLANSPENMHAWLADTQALKPGSRMPTVPLEPGDRAALVAYLGSLR